MYIRYDNGSRFNTWFLDSKLVFSLCIYKIPYCWIFWGDKIFDDYHFPTFLILILELQALSLMIIILKPNFEAFSFENLLENFVPSRFNFQLYDMYIVVLYFSYIHKVVVHKPVIVLLSSKEYIWYAAYASSWHSHDGERNLLSNLLSNLFLL